MSDNGLSPSDAYQRVRAQLSEHGDPALNLARHQTLWMEQPADQLIAENLHRGASGEGLHPRLFGVQQQVVSMLADLYHAPDTEQAAGFATASGVEALLLAGLAHKWSWRTRRVTAGQPNDRPNIIIGAGQQRLWLRFARYFDVEARTAPAAPAGYSLAPDAVQPLLDEHTIAVTSTLSSAVTGEPDPIVEMSALLDDVQHSHGWDIPLHVDAAAGGFIFPFTEPEFAWDFRLPRVRSISVSSHKHGGVYPGLGWLLFREPGDLPDELLFDVPVNGRVEPIFTLSASHGGSLALAQYYNLLRHGRAGYHELALRIIESSSYLGERLLAIEHFELLGPGRRLPIVTVCTPSSGPSVSFTQLSAQLGQRGWTVEAGALPGGTRSAELLRFIIPEHFSRDMVDMLARDILDDLETQRTQA